MLLSRALLIRMDSISIEESGLKSRLVNHSVARYINYIIYVASAILINDLSH